MTNELYVTFEGPQISEQGVVPVDALVSALQGVQDALQLMVEHLSEYQRKPGKPPKWIKEQSSLQLAATRPGSFVAALTLGSTAIWSEEMVSYGEQAFHALQRWDGEDTSLPKTVVTRLRRLPNNLPPNVRLWLGDSEAPKRVEIRRRGWVMRPTPEAEQALIYGWLKMVNWDKRTAQLHRYRDRYVLLRFDSAMDEEMRRLATRFVEVRGGGFINENDQWQWVWVDEIFETRSTSKPFDMEAFLNDPNPKVFDPETVVTASEPFDVDEFIRAIREGRDA